MNKSTLSSIIYMVLVIGLLVLVFKFIIWALPLILLLILGFIIYKTIKDTKKEIKSEKVVSRETNKKKKMKVIHEFDDED